MRASTNAWHRASCPLLLIVFATRHIPFVTSLADEICYLKNRYLRVLSASDFQGVQVWCMPSGPSIPYQLQKSAVVLTDLPRFLEGAGPFAVEATEIALDILDVIFEIAADDS